MKASLLILLFALCSSVQCRKIVQVDKHANTAFINMEGGGAPKQPAKVAPTPVKPLDSLQSHNAPAQPAKPNTPPAQAAKPPVAQPAKPTPIAQPSKPPARVEPMKPGSPPLALPASTPGPGSVKQLITYYDSQGKGSVIRPYSYAQAVKQGKK